MPLFSDNERQFADALSRLAYCNPFLPERLEFERQALGQQYDDSTQLWRRDVEVDAERANVERIDEIVQPLAVQLRDRLIQGVQASQDELSLYEDLILYRLYYFFRHDFVDLLKQDASTGAKVRSFWKAFSHEFDVYLTQPGRRLPGEPDAVHLFAGFFQLRRAFHHIYQNVYGSSLLAAQLRANIWQSIFTHNLRRYMRSLYNVMRDFTTLINGESGTGKELVARAVAMSSYIAFDAEKCCFASAPAETFFPLNLSALSPTLIESEIFGHCRGSFTGAVADRQGWLERCPATGSVFLDEIGDLDASIQVKLLRVLQSRSFQRLGETTDRKFEGKIIAATNRDLPALIESGDFRADFYYRLCADMVTTPSLRDQLASAPGDLEHLVEYIAHKICPDESEGLARETLNYVRTHLGPSYNWPGNIRELEQCVRNVLIRGAYQPQSVGQSGAAGHATGQMPLEIALANTAQTSPLTAEQLLGTYCTLIYLQTGNYEQTARILNLDRRTVKAKINQEELARLKEFQSNK